MPIRTRGVVGICQDRADPSPRHNDTGRGALAAGAGGPKSIGGPAGKLGARASWKRSQAWEGHARRRRAGRAPGWQSQGPRGRLHAGKPHQPQPAQGETASITRTRSQSIPDGLPHDLFRAQQGSAPTLVVAGVGHDGADAARRAVFCFFASLAKDLPARSI